MAGNEIITRHYRDRFQCSQHPKRPQAGQIAHLHADGRIAAGDDHKVQPVPRVAQVRVLVQHEALGDDLDHHFARVDGQENVSAMDATKITPG